MAGYTDGVAKRLSEQSMKQGLNTDYIGELKDNYTIEELKALTDTCYYLDNDQLQELKDNETLTINNNEYFTLYINDNELYLTVDWFETFENLSQGGLQYITDSDKNVLGVRLGAAGEHIGSVSVWVDTFKQVITQDGKEYPISEDDCYELNEVAETLYND